MLNHNICQLIQQKLDQIYEHIRNKPFCDTCGVRYTEKHEYFRHLSSYEHRIQTCTENKIRNIENNIPYLNIILGIFFYYIVYLYPVVFLIPIVFMGRSIYYFYKN